MFKLKPIILFVLVAFFAVLPLLFVIYSIGENWQGVIPAGYVYDNEFYMARMVKGTYIFPFGNNPFFIERTGDFNPALSVADYIAAIPLKLGLHINATMIFNSIFWNLVFIILLFLFLKQLDISSKWIFWLIPIIYLSVYGAMIRPVVWQVVLPFFMFFLFGLLFWLKNDSLFSKLIFAGGIAATFYVYPYTWQIASLILGFYFILFLKNRDWVKIRSFIQVAVLALIFASPAVYYIYKIFSDPAFSEFLKNIGSIKTHLPSKVSFQLSRWVIANILLWHLAVRFIQKLKENRGFIHARNLSIVHGLAIFILSVSPLITGRDGAIGDHMGRELFFWLSTSMSVFTYFVFSNTGFYNLGLYKKIIILVLVFINIVPVLKHHKRSLLQPFQATKSEITSVQDYIKPISWLDKYDKNPSVVWANSGVGTYIPILSKYYVISPPDLAFQYWNKKEEVQERYLVSKYFENLTPELLNDSAVLGHSYTRIAEELKWKSNLCEIFSFIKSCIPISSGLVWNELMSGKNNEINMLIEKNKKEIKPKISELMKKYKIVYAIKDLESEEKFDIEKFKNSKEIYNDGRFVIYKFQ